MEERFWSKVAIGSTNECWLWQASLGSTGYGQFNTGRSMAKAHRIAWELGNKGLIPADLMVCHHCDTPACVNPAHLFLGTQTDNMRDCFAKGRGNPAPGGRAAMTQKWANRKAS